MEVADDDLERGAAFGLGLKNLLLGFGEGFQHRGAVVYLFQGGHQPGIFRSRTHRCPQCVRIHAKFRKRGDPEETGTVGRKYGGSEGGDDVANFGSIENVHVFYRERYIALRQFFNQVIAIQVVSVENGEIVPVAPRVVFLAANIAGQVGRLQLPVAPDHDFDGLGRKMTFLLCRFFLPCRLQRLPLVVEALALPRVKKRGVLVNHAERAAKDRYSRSPVFVQHDELGPWEMAREETKGRARCPSKAVDRLIGVSDGKNVLFGAGEQLENFDLSKVSVLEFIDQDKAGASLFPRAEVRVALQ